MTETYSSAEIYWPDWAEPPSIRFMPFFGTWHVFSSLKFNHPSNLNQWGENLPSTHLSVNNADLGEALSRLWAGLRDLRSKALVTSNARPEPSKRVNPRLSSTTDAQTTELLDLLGL